MVASGGAVVLTAVAVVPVMSQPMLRWLWLNPWVRAPGRIRPISEIAAGVAVWTENAELWAMVAGAPVMAGR
jgi:hypothetical protein